MRDRHRRRRLPGLQFDAALARARTRRDAEEQYRVELEEIRSDGVASHPTKYGQQKVNKALTGPVPVSMGPAPNAASLYPVIDDAPTAQ